MNCRPGDIAIIVRSDFVENIGKLVEVERLHWSGEWVVVALSSMRSNRGPTKAGEKGLCLDSTMRPIRDQEGQDEILEYAGYPGVLL